MNRSAKFWVPMIIFQVAFGLMVFSLTRQHYLQAPAAAGAERTATSLPPSAQPQETARNDLEQLISLFPDQPVTDDPAVNVIRADEFFARQQYDQAAELYSQLINGGSDDVDIYNNLGITLHYLGRSNEALGVLDEGIALDPSYQRIWLTLGFVNSQVGNTEQARAALTSAMQLGANTEVGQAAQQMLNALGSG